VTVDYATAAGTAKAVGRTKSDDPGTLTSRRGDERDDDIPLTDGNAVQRGRGKPDRETVNTNGGGRLGTVTTGPPSLFERAREGIAGTDKKPQEVFTDTDGDMATVKMAGKSEREVFITDTGRGREGTRSTLIEVAVEHSLAGTARGDRDVT